MSDYDTADMKNLHYHAFNYRNAHSTDAGNAFNLLEEFVSKMCITAGEKWRDEWSEVCNENQILSNTCDESLAYIKELQAAQAQAATVKDSLTVQAAVEHDDIVPELTAALELSTASGHPTSEPPQYRAMWLAVKEELDTLKLRGGHGEAERVIATAPSEAYETEPPHPTQPVASIRCWTKNGEGHSEVVDWRWM